jgi:hypothetical protein
MFNLSSRMREKMYQYHLSYQLMCQHTSKRWTHHPMTIHQHIKNQWQLSGASWCTILPLCREARDSDPMLEHENFKGYLDSTNFEKRPQNVSGAHVTNLQTAPTHQQVWHDSEEAPALLDDDDDGYIQKTTVVSLPLKSKPQCQK